MASFSKPYIYTTFSSCLVTMDPEVCETFLPAYPRTHDILESDIDRQIKLVIFHSAHAALAELYQGGSKSVDECSKIYEYFMESKLYSEKGLIHLKENELLVTHIKQTVRLLALGVIPKKPENKLTVPDETLKAAGTTFNPSGWRGRNLRKPNNN